MPGGNLLYAAAGLGVWDGNIGLLARVGEDYPQDWLLSFKKHGWDTRGIHILAGALDLRYFQARLAPDQFQQHQPGNPLRTLEPALSQVPAWLPTSGRSRRPQAALTRPRLVQSDIPPDYLYAHTAHICPLDYLTTGRLLSTFRQANVTFLTLDPYAAYMTGTAFDDVRILLQGLTAFLPSEEELRALFWGRTNDLWQMAEDPGQASVVSLSWSNGEPTVRCSTMATSKKRWEIPAYPSRLVDLTGAGDSFCGGFSAGYLKTFDPLRAVLHGSVSASLTIEGSGAFHALDALPGLAQARLDALSDLVRQV